jgi:hypothetical protein
LCFGEKSHWIKNSEIKTKTYCQQKYGTKRFLKNHKKIKEKHIEIKNDIFSRSKEQNVFCSDQEKVFGEKNLK